MKTYDLVVVGAGILGVAHAFHAARKGKKVLVLERHSRPQGASIRNFGQAVASGQAIPVWRNHGIRALHWYQEIQAKHDLSVRNLGSIYIASDPQEEQLLEEMHRINQDMGYTSELWTRTQLLERYPALRAGYCRMGLYYPQEISLNPRQAIHRLIEFCEQSMGVDFVFNRPIHAMEPHGEEVVLWDAWGGRYQAGRAVLCNGHEFRTLFARHFAESKLEVSVLQMLRTKPILKDQWPGNILTGLSIRRYEAFHSCPSFKNLTSTRYQASLQAEGIHLLLKQEPDGSIIIGDSHHYATAAHPEALGFDYSEHIQQLLLNEAMRVMNLHYIPIQETWLGYYSTHPSGIFEQDIEDRIFIRTGIGGKGMSTALGYAEQQVDQIFE